MTKYLKTFFHCHVSTEKEEFRTAKIGGTYRKYGHMLMSVYLMGLTYVKEERVTFVFLVDNIFSLILLRNRK